MTIKEAAKRLHVETHVLRYWEDELQLDIKRNAQGHRYYDERDIRLFECVQQMKEEGLMLKDIRNAMIRAKRANENEKGEQKEQKERKEQEEQKEQKERQKRQEREEQVRQAAKPMKKDKYELEPVHTRIDEDKDSMLERMEKIVVVSEQENHTELDGTEQISRETETEQAEKAKHVMESNENEQTTQVTESDKNDRVKLMSETDKVVDFKQAQLQSVMNRVIANALRENKEIITSSIKKEVTADVMRQFDAVMREKEEREEARYRRLDNVLREIQQANEEAAATKNRKGMWKKHRKLTEM